MPCRKQRDGTHRQIVYPANAETRTMIKQALLTEYEKVLPKATTRDRCQGELLVYLYFCLIGRNGSQDNDYFCWQRKRFCDSIRCSVGIDLIESFSLVFGPLQSSIVSSKFG